MRHLSFLRRHKEFIGHVATLMSGKAAAGLVAIFTMPIVSRLFVPSDFGVAAFFVSIISIVALVATLRYEIAFVLPEDDQEALALKSLAFWLALCTCSLLLMFLFVHEVSNVQLPALNLLGELKWLLPVGVLLMAGIHIQEAWLTRTKSFKAASLSLVVGNATTSGSRIGIGAIGGSSAAGLIVGHLLGMTARFSIQRNSIIKNCPSVEGSGNWSSIRAAALRYSDFPKLNAPAGLVFSLGQHLPVLLFGVMFSPAVAGFYSMANQLMRTPVNMLADSTRRVFLQKASSIRHEGRSLQKAFLLTSGGLAIMGLPALVLLSIFGQPLSAWFLGDRWSIAGEYIEILAPWFFMLWVTAPCNPIFVVLRRQQLWLALQLILTLLRLAVFGFAYLIGSEPESTLQAFVAITVLATSATWITALLLIQRTPAHQPDMS